MQSLKDTLSQFNLLEIQKRAKLYQSQTMNSTKSNGSKRPYCVKCNDTGTTTNIRWEKADDYPIPYQVTAAELCECERERIFSKYNATAGMKSNEQARTFETAIIDEENKWAFDQGKFFFDDMDSHVSVGTWLYIYGDDERARKMGKSAYGTGKSYLMHCIGNRLTQLKQKAIYITEDKLFEEIKNTYNQNSEERESDVLWRFENVPFLLIDDLFKSKTTDWTEDKVFYLLNNRKVPGKITIINSNYAPNRIELTMPKNGKAIASRILEKALLVEMIGKDRRRSKAAQRWNKGTPL